MADHPRHATVSDAETSIDRAAMPEYKLSDAINLFNQQVTTNYSLWALFVIVTFAFSQFGGQTGSLTVAAIITPGYIAFTASNIYLIRRSILLQIALKKDIVNFLCRSRDADKNPFEATIRKLVEPINSMVASYIVHFVIDACAIGALWYRGLAARPVPGLFE